MIPGPGRETYLYRYLPVVGNSNCVVPCRAVVIPDGVRVMPGRGYIYMYVYGPSGLGSRHPLHLMEGRARYLISGCRRGFGCCMTRFEVGRHILNTYITDANEL